MPLTIGIMQSLLRKEPPPTVITASPPDVRHAIDDWHNAKSVAQRTAPNRRNGFAAGCEAWLCLAVSGSLMTWAAPLVRALP